MKAQPLTVYLPDTRGVEVSSFGKGNLKIGPNVYTYSRLPGNRDHRETPFGTCPGSTVECEAVCYAKRIRGPVADVYYRNSLVNTVPEALPADCRLLRLHVSGDFNHPTYIDGWRRLLEARPDVRCWAYTRSWRVPALLPALEALRALPNVQLFASVDSTTPELPPIGWRRAWIDGDWRGDVNDHESPTSMLKRTDHNRVTFDLGRSYVCPEQTGRQPNCETCRYCFDGKRGDITFLLH